jgi:hypothetical protein
MGVVSFLASLYCSYYDYTHDSVLNKVYTEQSEVESKESVRNVERKMDLFQDEDIERMDFYQFTS